MKWACWHLSEGEGTVTHYTELSLPYKRQIIKGHSGKQKPPAHWPVFAFVGTVGAKSSFSPGVLSE